MLSPNVTYERGFPQTNRMRNQICMFSVASHGTMVLNLKPLSETKWGT